jgi:hypothetical protein
MLQQIAGAQEHMLEMIESKKFKFDGTGGRWETLAFSLYTEICELSALAGALLEHDLGEDEGEV